MTAPAATSEWLTPSQAAPMLGLSAAKVRRLCADKRIRRRQEGTEVQPRYKLHVDDVRAYINAGYRK